MQNDKLNEKELQKAVQYYLSDPSVVRFTQSNRRLQILSPGRLNYSEGPDFLDIAILLDGYIVIGDAEFHLKSSYWDLHKHSNNDAYSKVILHIVFEDDKELNNNFETLLLDSNEINKTLLELKTKEPETDIFSIEELQHFALLRIIRKTIEAQNLLNKLSILDALTKITLNFINKYNQRKRRPVYNQIRLEKLIENLPNSLPYHFLIQLKEDTPLLIFDTMQNILKKKISDEGAHLRREIVLNCVLPMALALAKESARIDLFLWYWSTPCLNEYALLKRRFPNIPQNFLWQQQGMLEYLLEYGRKPNLLAEAIKDYGISTILSFYSVGRAPFGEKPDNPL